MCLRSSTTNRQRCWQPVSRHGWAISQTQAPQPIPIGLRGGHRVGLAKNTTLAINRIGLLLLFTSTLLPDPIVPAAAPPPPPIQRLLSLLTQRRRGGEGVGCLTGALPTGAALPLPRLAHAAPLLHADARLNVVDVTGHLWPELHKAKAGGDGGDHVGRGHVNTRVCKNSIQRASERKEVKHVGLNRKSHTQSS